MAKKIFPRKMTALCVAQPWAFCIFKKGKNVENRKRSLKKRGTIAIYVSANIKKSRFLECRDECGIDLKPDKMVYGAIIGFVDIVEVIRKKDVVKNTREWFAGPYGYVLKNAIYFKKPVFVRPPNGAVIFWHLRGPELKKCLKQISQKRRNRFIPFE